MTERIGVFICDCSSNISRAMDTQKLCEFALTLENVAEARLHALWCSEQGREELKKCIKEKNLTRVVIAACSPKQYEKAFQKSLTEAGLNPYLLQIANIREQVAWVTPDKEKATEKAKVLIKAAVKRVMLQEPLEKAEIECNSNVVVLGAGVAGIKAALTLAQKNRKVYLVEKEGWIGGKVAAYEKSYPNMECAPCMIEGPLGDILHSDRVTLLTNSELTNIKGFFGSFEVQIFKKARFVDSQKCIGCGACFDACPVKVKNKFNGNLSERHAIYLPFQGMLPNVPVIDRDLCLRFKGQDCRKCEESCPLGALKYDDKDETINASAGAIVVATGFELYDTSLIKNLAPDNPNVFTSYQLERILSTTGPTEGELLRADNSAPSSIAFVHCAGSRSEKYKEYCSGVCCAYTLKLAHLIKEHNKDVKIYDIFSDWCLAGKGLQEFKNKVSKDNTEYIRVSDPNEIKVSPEGGKLRVQSEKGSIVVDMLVLSPAIIPGEDTAKLAAMLGIPLDKDGFFAEEHMKLSPASTTMRGIYIAGCAAGPKDIPQSVMQGQSCAGMALNALVPGEKLEVEVATAEVNEKLCGGCRVCISLCPYQAINFDETKKVSAVNSVLCRGCGVCVSSCPAGAIKNKHFTVEQIFSEIEGIL